MIRILIPSPSDAEKAAGFKRFILVEDLSPANHKLLKDLQNDDRVEKVWSVDGEFVSSCPVRTSRSSV
jgi:hypothetical protein